MQSVNPTLHRHQLYGVESPIEPTIRTRKTKPCEEELITPLSPGGTSIATKKKYVKPNKQLFFTPNRTQKQINRINEINRRILNGSNKTITNEDNHQYQTPNRTPIRSIQNNNSTKRQNRPTDLIDVEDSPSKIFRNNSHSKFNTVSFTFKTQTFNEI
ncbi:hypothetical protein M0813_17755 [Anaeramoeba flamelloides]|uniref:Uncharacterized protein n=1 Tax=Anaeramoeba flamelloides TaxID=1746091 RepID=A0ABQ8YUW7_9EUKA|nr:hypothetical protein M0813_17755 [Anaeramoeba flamelloides]